MWFVHLMAGKSDDVFNFPRVKGDDVCWSSVRLGVAGFRSLLSDQRPCLLEKLQSFCPLFSTLIPTYFSLLLLWPSSSRSRCLSFHSTPA